jgi:hypothetical protein
MKKTIQLLMIIAAMVISVRSNAQTVCAIDAGANQNICCSGNCVTLTASVLSSGSCCSGNPTFQWSPTTGLSSPTSAVTSACPSVTTVYTVCATFYQSHCSVICCTACDVVTVSVGGISCCRVTSLADNAMGKNASEIKVYPNPAKSDITIDVAVPLKNAEINIYDVSGRIIWQKKNVSEAGKMQVDVSAFPKGIYFIKAIEAGADVYKNKILIE